MRKLGFIVQVTTIGTGQPSNLEFVAHLITIFSLPKRSLGLDRSLFSFFFILINQLFSIWFAVSFDDCLLQRTKRKFHELNLRFER